MFAATNASPRALHSLANAYQQIGLETATTNATPHKLIELLFEGFADAVARARGALLGRQIEAKGRAIGHAARIVEEGLKAGLNQKDGGRIAALGPDASRDWPAGFARVIEAHGLLAMPGLVNAHFHSPGNLMKGCLPGLPLELFMLREVPPLASHGDVARLAYLRP